MFIYSLALKLGMTASMMKEVMTWDELLDWAEFFERRPPGWEEDNRTYMIMRSFGTEAKPEDLFHSIAVMKQRESKSGPSEQNTLSKIAKMMRYSTNPNKVELKDGFFREGGE